MAAVCFPQYLSDTIASVFDEVYTADVSGSTNRLLYASNAKDLMQTFALGRKSLADPELSAMMETAAGEMSFYQAGTYRMTDDKAPVEVLGMQVIDDLIVGEIGYYKELFKTEGISGILGADWSF